jgi:hypothetical protein
MSIAFKTNKKGEDITVYGPPTKVKRDIVIISRERNFNPSRKGMKELARRRNQRVLHCEREGVRIAYPCGTMRFINNSFYVDINIGSL